MARLITSLLADWRHRACCLAVLAGPMGSAIAQDSTAAQALDTVTVVAQKANVATKTDTALDEIPQSVSVIPAELARARGADTLQDALRYSAGVTAEPYGLDPRADGFFVRGLDAQQTQDGFRRLYNFSPVPRPDVYAIDRIEILRGPASVLYGQGTTGGLVNAVSKRPRRRDGAEASVRGGSFGHAELRMDMTGGFGSDDAFAGRLVTVARDADLPTRGLPNNRLLLAPSLTWFITDATRLTWLGQFQRDNSASAQQFLPYAAVKGVRGAPLRDVRLRVGDPRYDHLDSRQNTHTLLFEHDVATDWSLSAKVRDSRSDTDFAQIYTNSYLNPADPFIPGAPGRSVPRIYYAVSPVIASQQADVGVQGRFATGAVRHNLLLGVDYARFRQRSRSASSLVSPIDLDNPVSLDIVVPALVDEPGQRARQFGVYAQDQMKLGERLTWVVGGRHDNVTTQTEGVRATELSETTWRTGVVYDVAPGVSPYVSYSESFTPVQGVDVHGSPFEPLRGEQIEAGVKWMPSGSLAVTAAIFDMKESNRLTNDPNDITNVVQTGRVRSRGGELEALYSGASGWTVTGAASFTDVEVLESSFAYEQGRQLNDVPRWLASLWVDRRLRLGSGTLSLGGGARYVGQTTSYGAMTSIESPANTLFDLRAEYAQGPYFARLNVNNVADRMVFGPCRVLGDCFTGMPRTVLAEVGLRY